MPFKISDECEVGNVGFSKSCEHCYTLEPKSIMWCDGGTWWCIDCASMDEEFNLTEEEIHRLKVIQKTKRILYYKSKINELERNEY